MTCDTAATLDALYKKLADRAAHHAGFPYNLTYSYEKLSRFMRYSLNNLGDPYVDGSYRIGTKDLEREVVSFFADLYRLRDPWGYVTACGTEGNYYGLWLGTRLFPDAPIITSRDSHYSVAKAARIAKVRLLYVDSHLNGEIDYSDFRRVVMTVPGPMIVNVNIGTTLTGAIDRLDRICDILESSGQPFHIHCDSALGGLLEPYLNEESALDFSHYPIGSLSVSGHKFVGAAIPCGIVVARHGLVGAAENRVDYIGSVDTTIMGSRSGLAVLFIWQAVRQRNFREEALSCRRNAEYLHEALRERGWEPLLNPHSITVVFARPPQVFCDRWQLSAVDDRAHVVVMQNHTRSWIDTFLNDLGVRHAQQVAV